MTIILACIGGGVMLSVGFILGVTVVKSNTKENKLAVDSLNELKLRNEISANILFEFRKLNEQMRELNILQSK